MEIKKLIRVLDTEKYLDETADLIYFEEAKTRGVLPVLDFTKMLYDITNRHDVMIVKVSSKFIVDYQGSTVLPENNIIEVVIEYIDKPFQGESDEVNKIYLDLKVLIDFMGENAIIEIPIPSSYSNSISKAKHEDIKIIKDILLKNHNIVITKGVGFLIMRRK